MPRKAPESIIEAGAFSPVAQVAKCLNDAVGLLTMPLALYLVKRLTSEVFAVPPCPKCAELGKKGTSTPEKGGAQPA